MKRLFNGLLAGLLVLTGLELLTGVALLAFYTPTVEKAYTSAKSIGASPFLGPLQSFHHWLSAALIAVGALLILVGLARAAYSAGNKIPWIGAVLLVLLYFFAQLTGHLLPWDEHAVQTAVIETSIAQSAPLVGTFQADLLRNGKYVGAGTLSVWYWAHVAVLAVIILAVGAFLWRRLRSAGASKRAMTVLAVGAGGAALIAAALARVQYGGPATPADYGGYGALPEWYILPLHSLLGWAQKISPSLAFVGTMVIPGIAVLLILGAPWLDRRASAGKKALYGPIFAGVLAIGTIVLCATSGGDVAAPAGPNPLNFSATTASGPSVKLDPALILQGKKLISTLGCTDCHVIDGKGGSGGPVLNGAGTRHPDLEWQAKHLANPKSEVPGSTMPSFGYLPRQQQQALAEYLTSLK